MIVEQTKTGNVIVFEAFLKKLSEVFHGGKNLVKTTMLRIRARQQVEEFRKEIVFFRFRWFDRIFQVVERTFQSIFGGSWATEHTEDKFS